MKTQQDDSKLGAPVEIGDTEVAGTFFPEEKESGGILSMGINIQREGIKM